MIDLRIAGAALAASALLGAVGWHWTPVIGPHARLERLHDDLTVERAKVKAWSDAFKKEVANRTAEREQAEQALAQADKACSVRVAEARKSAKIIQEIVNAPVKHDPSGCPIRGIIGADRLRDALQPSR